MNYNRVCRLSDFTDPDLRVVLAELFPHESGPQAYQHRKNWEIAQAVRALQDFGALKSRRARVLGVGAGSEPTIYHLTRYADVHATDLYAEPGDWADFAPVGMLRNPDAFAPGPYERQRLTVQHMDARDLRYPTDHFDGVWSCSSIEHFGTPADIAQVMREIARVLKPGGVAALSTEYRVGGADKAGWPGVVVFSAETLQQAVEPSGLEWVDNLDAELDAATLGTAFPLKEMVRLYRAKQPTPRPHIVLEQDGILFTSVSVVLRKAR